MAQALLGQAGGPVDAWDSIIFRDGRRLRARLPKPKVENAVSSLSCPLPSPAASSVRKEQMLGPSLQPFVFQHLLAAVVVLSKQKVSSGIHCCLAFLLKTCESNGVS